ncbi:CSC1 1 isoform X2 [Pelobates cultripes]|uniref:CSC1 1 isoform X2 n=1 Tax=Pelobates cultripes TaxID=61616 RepID=A0AAD1VUH1_PELCU|nr:CSC1 1 isoform X2 [Pelobates cultripes]
MEAPPLQDLGADSLYDVMDYYHIYKTWVCTKQKSDVQTFSVAHLHGADFTITQPHQWLFGSKQDWEGVERLECLFLPNQGSFFVNYIINSAFVGNGMSLIRFPDVFYFVWNMATAKSAAERKTIRKNQVYQIELGVMYADMIFAFTVIMAYSLTNPLIALFGMHYVYQGSCNRITVNRLSEWEHGDLTAVMSPAYKGDNILIFEKAWRSSMETGMVYIVHRHIVDRYNVSFAFVSVQLDKKIHFEAIILALTGPLFSLLWLFCWSFVKLGIEAPTTIFTLCVIITTIVMCVIYIGLGRLKLLGCLNYKTEECPTFAQTHKNGATVKAETFQIISETSVETTQIHVQMPEESLTGKESKSEEVRYQWNELTPSHKDYVVIDIEDETSTPSRKDYVVIDIEDGTPG